MTTPRMITLHPITAATAHSEPVARSELLQAVCASTVAMYPGGVPPLPWAGYLAEEDGQLVGTCAFKAPPESGEVEIAYFTFPGHEGRGVATRMAAQLIAIAQREGLRRIIAQTLPGPGASTAILQKLGFICSGERVHPEDGKVWQWERTRDAT